ncbi:MAG: DUF4864 domain-containing protein [Heteroscytonema crispum UTEX LB 1556]
MEVSDRDLIAILTIIENQLQAFQNDDAKGAFAFASPGIQAQLGTPENFMDMVRTAYQAVYRPRSVLFEQITTIQGNIAQPVLLLNSDGIPVKALYLMEKQRDRTWRINGCFLIPVDAEIS